MTVTTTFQKDDNVTFINKGQTIAGVIMHVNAKTVFVLETNEYNQEQSHRVPFAKLQAVA
jgi:hypothetical protein